MSDAILARLDNIEHAIKQYDSPLCFKEAAAFLKCSHSYLYKLTHRRIVPYFKPLGKKCFFKREDLEKFLFSHPVKTRQQIEQEATDHVSTRKGAIA